MSYTQHDGGTNAIMYSVLKSDINSAWFTRDGSILHPNEPDHTAKRDSPYNVTLNFEHPRFDPGALRYSTGTFLSFHTGHSTSEHNSSPARNSCRTLRTKIIAKSGVIEFFWWQLSWDNNIKIYAKINRTRFCNFCAKGWQVRYHCCARKRRSSPGLGIHQWTVSHVQENIHARFWRDHHVIMCHLQAVTWGGGIRQKAVQQVTGGRDDNDTTSTRRSSRAVEKFERNT